MDTSFFLAKVLGILAILMGASMVLRRKMLLSIFHELSQSRAVSYILGVLMVVFGLVIVSSHNVWRWGFELAITLFGWIALLEGTMYLFISEKALKKYLRTLDSKRVYYFIGVTYLVVGAVLAYIGFTR